MNTEREQAYWDEWDKAALRRIIQQQCKITEASKKLEMKKLYQALIICDDLADVPQLTDPTAPGYAVHQGPSHADQHLGELAEAAAIAQPCGSTSNSSGGELSPAAKGAALPVIQAAMREPYSFLFVYYLKPGMKCSTSALKSVSH